MATAWSKAQTCEFDTHHLTIFRKSVSTPYSGKTRASRVVKSRPGPSRRPTDRHDHNLIPAQAQLPAIPRLLFANPCAIHRLPAGAAPHSLLPLRSILLACCRGSPLHDTVTRLINCSLTSGHVQLTLVPLFTIPISRCWHLSLSRL